MPAVVGGANTPKTRNLPLNGNDLSVHWEELPLVNLMRQRCQHWQEDGFPGATHVTRSLLRHWLEPEQDEESRLYYAQQDAILAAVYLNEGHEDPAHDEVCAALENELNQQREYHPKRDETYSHLQRMQGVRRSCHKMATGTGKTAVIAALILYHATNHQEYPTDPRFTNNFLVLAPNLTVRNRLTGAVIPNADELTDEYAERDLLPSPRDAFRNALNLASVVVSNWQSFKPREPGEKLSSTGAKVIKASDPQAQLDHGENETEAAIRVAYDGNPRNGKVLAINDEAHHCHYGNPDKPDAKPTVWMQSIVTLLQADRLHGVIDLSATPTFPEATKGHGTFPWIISDCNLVEAQEAGLTQIPRAPTSRQNPETARKMRNLYGETPRKERDAFNGDNCALLREAISHIADDWSDEVPMWRVAHANDDRSAALPAVAVVTSSTKNANAVYEYLASGRAGNARIDEELDHPLANWRNQGGRKAWLDGPPRTIVVHSDIDEREKRSSTAVRDMQQQFAELSERYQRHYPDELAGLEPLETIRRVLNTVGRPGHPGEAVRCVVSVSMLNEGWDARNVTHLLGFRPFKSSLLCEQVAGRTLRRSVWDLDPDTGMFQPEYATVIGIPFRELEKPGSSASPPTVYPTITVETPLERAQFSIRWPNIRELTVPSRERRIAALPKEMSEEQHTPSHRIPEHTPSDVTLEPIIGTSKDLEEHGPLTKKAWRYRVAGTITEQVKRDAVDGSMLTENGQPSEPQQIMPQALFCDLLAVMQTLEDSGRLLPPASGQYPSDATTIGQSADFVRNAGCRFVFVEPEGPAMVVKRHKTPWLSTEMREHTVQDDPKRVFKHCRKSHATHARCDSNWEKQVAEMLEAHPKVHRWARNHRTRWEIPYVYQGQPRAYRPDFVAVTPLNDGMDHHVVIEVKGQEDDVDLVKKRWAETWWVPAVNADTEYGADSGRLWSYLYLDSDTFLKGITEAFNAHLAEARPA